MLSYTAYHLSHKSAHKVKYYRVYNAALTRILIRDQIYEKVNSFSFISYYLFSINGIRWYILIQQKVHDILMSVFCRKVQRSFITTVSTIKSIYNLTSSHNFSGRYWEIYYVFLRSNSIKWLNLLSLFAPILIKVSTISTCPASAARCKAVFDISSCSFSTLTVVSKIRSTILVGKSETDTLNSLTMMLKLRNNKMFMI